MSSMNKKEKERIEASIREAVTREIVPFLLDPKEGLGITLADATGAIEGALVEFAELYDAAPDHIEWLRSILLDDLHRRFN
jgi:hypothetical protein